MRTRFSLLLRVTFLLSLMLAAALVLQTGPNKVVEASSSNPIGQKRTPPTDGKPIEVGFVLTDGVTMIDFAGPWEVFQDAGGPDGVDHFHLFTVGASKSPVRTAGGMTVIPD